jgi:UDP-glucose 4-epimerase
MHYLITGGAGFIGSHLADYLIEQGHSVTAYDNLSTGRVENIAHLRDHERFELAIGNVLDYHTLEQHVIQSDRIVHLAAAVGVKLIMEQPVETIVTNVQGTENVLKLANYHDTKALVASTSEVYGKSMDKDIDIDELNEDSDWTLGPTTKRRWAYACSKAMDEFLARAYFDEKGLPVVVARFFNTVGPRQMGQYGMVIPNFVQQALKDEPIRVFGDGEQTRCFTYVGDAVRAIVDLLDAPDAEGEIVNIGSNEEVSINQLAERVRQLSGSASEITHIPYEEVYGPGFEDMQRRTPDISKLQRITGYTPSYATDDILEAVIHYFRHGQRAQTDSAAALAAQKALTV